MELPCVAALARQQVAQGASWQARAAAPQESQAAVVRPGVGVARHLAWAAAWACLAAPAGVAAVPAVLAAGIPAVALPVEAPSAVLQEEAAYPALASRSALSQSSARSACCASDSG